MANSIPRKAIIAISSYNGIFYADGKRTGLFYSEALDPYEVFTKAGFEVDLATETGAFGIDEHSIEKPFLTDEVRVVLNNPKHPFNVKLNSQLMKPSDVKKEEYGLFFASAGHAALYDYPKAKGLHTIAGDIWNRGGIVSATCHGPAMFPEIIDPKTGKSIIEGRTVTGFTLEGEIELRVIDQIRKDNVITVPEAVVKVGATYSSPLHPWDDYSITDGRVVTGANPASARSAAERAVKVFEQLSGKEAERYELVGAASR
jgi:putative intracellular protease/amidase